jgi:hypothetical protein
MILFPGAGNRRAPTPGRCPTPPDRSIAGHVCRDLRTSRPIGPLPDRTERPFNTTRYPDIGLSDQPRSRDHGYAEGRRGYSMTPRRGDLILPLVSLAIGLALGIVIRILHWPG